MNPAIRRATRLAISAAALLMLSKGAIAFWSGSLALLASSLDSGLDVLASGINALFLRHAHTPADEGHPFGHGKAEGVASFVQGILISISGIGLLGESIRRILSGTHVDHLGPGIAILAISIPTSIFVGVTLRRIGRRERSEALEADASHYLSDVAAAGGSLLALALIRLGAPPLLDPITSLLISGYILHTAWNVSRLAYDSLLDKALPEAAMIVEDAVSKRTPSCNGYHALRARSSGVKRFVEFRLFLDRNLTFVEAHRITEEISDEIEKRLGPGTEVIAHADPVALPVAPER